MFVSIRILVHSNSSVFHILYYMQVKKEVFDYMKSKWNKSNKSIDDLLTSEDFKKKEAKKQRFSNKAKTKRGNTKIHKELEDKVNLKDDELHNVIVHVSENIKKDLTQLKSQLGFSIKPKVIFEMVDAFSTELTSKQVKELSRHHDITFIEEDITIKTNLNTATTWFGVNKASRNFDVDGSGITIAVIDTGIDSQHVDLDEGKVIGWKDFVNDRNQPYDDNGHGTHVASIAAGTGEGNERFKGVAPAASLVGVKVLDANGSGSMSQILSGIDWIVANREKFGLRIANLSFGSSSASDGQDALSLAVNQATRYGITFFVAAGNAGPEKYTIGTPGSAERAITVGSMADVMEGGYFLNLFSSRGPTLDGRIKPDIVGPGYYITAAKANTVNGYVTYSGTSMATPFVAGTAALMLSANPSLSHKQIKNILTSTSEEWGKSGNDIDYGAGRLQGYQAIQKAGNLEGSQPKNRPDHIRETSYLETTNDYQLFEYQVDELKYPLALTLLQENENADFDVYVYNPNRNLVASSTSIDREEKLSFTPPITGEYLIVVYSYQGGGAYYLDISGG